MTDPVALVVAKAPVPGRVKTRLAVDIGSDRAADLAAASLLDTMDACESLFEDCHVSLDGSLAGACRSAEIRSRLQRWTVHPQGPGDLGQRLSRAHRDAARNGTGAVVQVGMDTPQLASGLAEVACLARSADAVLGPATDGGWWVLSVRDASLATVLEDVTMSTGTTYVDTRDSLLAAGADVVRAGVLTDVDTAADAEVVAASAAGTRFAAAWAGMR